MLSHVDYCNCFSWPASHHAWATSMNTECSCLTLLSLNLRDHVKPALKQLHWLPVIYRIQYKLCLLMHHVHFGMPPQYLTDAVQSVTSAVADLVGARRTPPNMSNTVLGLSLGSRGSASPAQLLGICCQTTCSAVQTLTFLIGSSRLFCFNWLFN